MCMEVDRAWARSCVGGLHGGGVAQVEGRREATAKGGEDEDDGTGPHMLASVNAHGLTRAPAPWGTALRHESDVILPLSNHRKFRNAKPQSLTCRVMDCFRSR